MNDFDIANTLLRTSLDRVYGKESNKAKIAPGQEVISQLETHTKKDLTEHEWTKIERHLVKTLKNLSGHSAAVAEDIDEKAKNLFAAMHIYKDKIPPERFELIHKSLLAIQDAAQLKIEESLFQEFKKDARQFLEKNPFFKNDASKENAAFKLKLAYYLAEHDGRLLCECFEDFALEDEQDRIELAKLMAKNHPLELVDQIAMFNISKESALEKIFLRLAKKDPQFILDLKEWPIISEKRIVRIFTVLAGIFPDVVAQRIGRYTIWNADERANIAKRAAEKDGLSVLKALRNFKITDQKALAAIVRKAIIQNPFAIALLPQVNLHDVRENMYMVLAAVSLNKNVVNILPKMNQREIDEVIDLIKSIEQNADNAVPAKQKLSDICADDEDLAMVSKKIIEK